MTENKTKQSGLEWLLAQEKQRQAELLSHCFGYYLLLLSSQILSAAPNCPIKQHFIVRPRQEGASGQNTLVANWDCLPFAPDSIDVVILSHVLDYPLDWEALLKEIGIILRHDGKLLVSGFNPCRLRARRLAKRYHAQPLQLKFCSSVMLVLQNAGFEICEVRHYGFFAIKNKRLAKYVNKLCRFFPAMACGYLILAQKKVLAAIPAKPGWQNPILEPEKAAASTSCRVK